MSVPTKTEHVLKLYRPPSFNIRGSKTLLGITCGSLKHCANGWVTLCMHQCFVSNKKKKESISFFSGILSYCKNSFLIYPGACQRIKLTASLTHLLDYCFKFSVMRQQYLTWHPQRVLSVTETHFKSSQVISFFAVENQWPGAN